VPGVALLALTALTACSEQSVVALDTTSGSSSASAPAAEASTSASASASASASGSASGSGSGSAAAVDRPQLVLEVGGLGVVAGSSVRHLPFGTSRASVSTALTTTLGELKVTRLEECGQGARTQLDRQGFSVLLQGTRFVGWTDAGGPDRHLTTVDGIGVGSTLGQVRAQYPGVQVLTGTLGPEFTSTGLSGLVTATTAAAKVTTIYAGETCFFR